METKNLTKQDVDGILDVIQTLYLADKIPWVCGYSGGKDSTATVQLLWSAISQLSEEQRHHKTIHIISTDTLVESPVVSAWVMRSLKKLQDVAEDRLLPFKVHRLTPKINNTYWVNLIGRGYPFPRANLRWCTSRLKIDPSNNFIQSIIASEGETILILGTRKAESTARRAVMESYERRRYREFLSPNGAMPNSYVFSPIEEWTNDNVWQYLMQNENPWNHSNKELLAMYKGASADGECPLVLDTSTPSCGNSRFGCWTCTLVTEDRSMAAMIQNDEEKAWMLPLLELRNDIADINQDRDRRDFRRMNGHLTWHNNRLVHGPYTKNTREYFLRRILEVEQYIQSEGPEEVRDTSLITMDELKEIRRIWLDEKHEFDDALPPIYKETTRQEFEDGLIKGNKFYGQAEWAILSELCTEMYPEEELLLEMQSSLLDVETRLSLFSSRRGIMKNIEAQIQRSFFINEEDAEKFAMRNEGIVTDASQEDIEGE